MRKIFLIGQAPSRLGNPEKPLEESIDRLSVLCDVPLHLLLSKTERLNLLQRWPGKSSGGKGDRFPIRDAEIAAGVAARFLRYARVVFVGSGVARAFRFSHPPLAWREWFDGGSAAVLPHPSGVNLWYNSEENRAVARRFLLDALDGGRP